MTDGGRWTQRSLPHRTVGDDQGGKAECVDALDRARRVVLPVERADAQAVVAYARLFDQPELHACALELQTVLRLPRALEIGKCTDLYGVARRGWDGCRDLDRP